MDCEEVEQLSVEVFMVFIVFMCAEMGWKVGRISNRVLQKVRNCLANKQLCIYCYYYCFTIITILWLLLTAIELSLGGSKPGTITDSCHSVAVSNE
jgi:hypothetical protein